MQGASSGDDSQPAAGHAFIWLAWATTFALGAYLRLNDLSASIVGQEVASNGPDAAYHARRMLQTWAHYPHVPSFDPLLNWPHGAVAPWPPGFDFAVASLALLARDRFGAQVVIALAPVLLGLALIALVGAATRALAPRAPWWTSWIAASLVAILPQAVSVARFGNPDHHVAEALILPALALWSLRAYNALDANAFGRNERLVLELGGAVLVAGSVATFTGAPIYVYIAAAMLALGELRRGHGTPARFALGVPALLLGAAGAALVYRPLVQADGIALSYAYPSYLQPLLVLCAAGGLLLASALGALSTGHQARSSLKRAGVLLGCAALALALWARAPLAELVRGLHEWFADSGSPLAALTENKPLFSHLDGHASHFARAYLYYGVLGPLLPVLVLAGLALHVRRHGLRQALPFVVWSLAITALMLLQNRFGRVGLVNLAICTAFTLQAAAERAGRVRALIVLAPALVLIADPAFHFYLWPVSPMPLPDMQEAGVFLREHTPPPVPGKRAGVLVPWGEAHFVVRYGERPVTATGFGIYVAPDAVEEVHQIWAHDEERLLRFARARDLGFVAVSAATYTGRTLHGKGPWQAQGGWNQQYLRQVPLATLLFAGSGIAGAGVPHLRHLMPRFASTMPPAGLPSFLPGVWVYEIVAGARIAGRAPPGALIRVQTPLWLRGRGAMHEAWTRANADGAFSLVTPLPTGYRGQSFETAPAALLHVGAAEQRIAVPEAAVRRGQTIVAP